MKFNHVRISAWFIDKIEWHLPDWIKSTGLRTTNLVLYLKN
jgi:hypothetical protein